MMELFLLIVCVMGLLLSAVECYDMAAAGLRHWQTSKTIAKMELLSAAGLAVLALAAAAEVVYLVIAAFSS